MAKIHSSRGKIYESPSNLEDNPTEYVESEGERLIKQMVQKQMNTHVTLEQQLQKPKEFETCMEFVPLTKYTSGQVSFSEFKDFAKKVSHLEDLKSSGLTEKEIDLFNDYEKGKEYFEEKYKKVEISALKSSLQEIYKKLHQKIDVKPRSCDGGIGRHKLELSLSVKPESDHTKLLQFALSCQTNESVDTRPLNHPINKLQEIEQELFGHLKTPVKRKRRKKYEEGAKNTKSQKLEPSVCSTSHNDSLECKTLWDSHFPPKSSFKSESRGERKQHYYTCDKRKLYTVKNGQIVALDDNKEEKEELESKSGGDPFVVPSCSKTLTSELLSLEKIQEKRLTLEEILELPHFKNYESGTPSKVLFIKNISSNVEESDLVECFKHFETPNEKRIIYRLLVGRMRGQAFVTFPSIEKATEALESLNGCYLKGKPLVIQFGRSKV